MQQAAPPSYKTTDLLRIEVSDQTSAGTVIRIAKPALRYIVMHASHVLMRAIFDTK